MNVAFEEIALALLSLEGVGPVTALKTLKQYDSVFSADEILGSLKVHQRRGAIIPTVDQLEDAINASRRLIEVSKLEGIITVGLSDSQYPAQLRELSNPPPVLFVKGAIDLLNQPKALAIVGTRRPSNYGSECAFRIAKRIADAGLTVVSGLALGIDTKAHEGCLDSNGKTIAVLPGGLDHPYPQSNHELASRIERSGGALVSEYPIGTKPRNQYFVQRNRIQSGLSAIVLVVETMIDGGTMKTAKFAFEQNRRLAIIVHPSRFDDDPIIGGNRTLLSEESDSVLPIRNDADLEILIDEALQGGGAPCDSQ
jgi:DNA processing protein